MRSGNRGRPYPGNRGRRHPVRLLRQRWWPTLRLRTKGRIVGFRRAEGRPSCRRPRVRGLRWQGLLVQEYALWCQQRHALLCPVHWDAHRLLQARLRGGSFRVYRFLGFKRFSGLKRSGYQVGNKTNFCKDSGSKPIPRPDFFYNFETLNPKLNPNP